jgi:hypothetical protein
MRTDDVECPECGDYMTLNDDGSDQTVQCPECKRHYSACYDAEFLHDSHDGHWKGSWSLKDLEPPNGRDEASG